MNSWRLCGLAFPKIRPTPTFRDTWKALTGQWQRCIQMESSRSRSRAGPAVVGTDCPSGATQSLQLILELTDARLRLGPGCPLVVGTGLSSCASCVLIISASPLVIKGHNVTSGRGIMPLQLTSSPTYIQSEHLAAPRQVPSDTRSIGIGSYTPSTRRSPASRVPWYSPVSSKRQYSGIPRAAYTSRFSPVSSFRCDAMRPPARSPATCPALR